MLHEENSEKKQDLYDRQELRSLAKFIAGFVDEHNQSPCINQCHYDGEKWKLLNDPRICIDCCKQKSTEEKNRYCPMMDKVLTKKLGNLYFDIKVSDTVYRDIRLYYKPFLLDIAKYMEEHPDEVISKRLRIVASEYLRIRKIRGKYTICNIRAKLKSQTKREYSMQEWREDLWDLALRHL